ncbi:hypothetical protein KNT81_gp166 [Proteus phage phiP4-3]|uniref:Uncharacterized protein n=3 Tax=Bragavirus TaxID=2948639 RepID=A0A2I6PFT5_9CAUD|nr:hypothetical protein AVT59_gp024 [Proteus phage vB_PmiM_Pm5461]YP_010091896.1 hypothetical protein KNT71_gp002 [Proteus phage PM2]YP_010093784.1 hypothetical protein KNT81_gp166 [Proteus phage phiP4-3]QQV89437.1 hypothetical protein SJ_19 [Proteus phage SJ_PmiM]AKA61886.1 hypothetical protein Pm5461_024 [Proteus phage vB_PmiM_Pm5461]ASZ76288.1 hypothetical protein [Proteus phage PM2]AUM58605.1 hypothetical protein phiP43_247 [Proteus phage phiP4-3]
MATFKIGINFSGYVRGRRVYEVEAETLEEALEDAEKYGCHGTLIEEDVVRDDTTESDPWAE